MMLSLEDVWQALSGQTFPFEDSRFKQGLTSVVIDSRLAEPGSLFVALHGERTDGHKYVAHAVSRGAIAALVEASVDLNCALIDPQQPESVSPIAAEQAICIKVDNTLEALQQIAGYWRNRFSPVVVGVTGSVGKTSTKEIIAAVLSRRYVTGKSRGNLNNEIGVPLTLLEMDDRYEYMVLEMGMYDVGEIADLCRIAKPSIGVVTNVGPVHLERAGSIERIAQGKTELVETLPPNGWAILNADDPLVSAMVEKTNARPFFYGLTDDADLWADSIESEGLDGIRFRFHYGKDVLHVRVPLIGRHSVHTALRAAAVGLVAGLSWEEIVSGLQDSDVQLRLVVARGLHGATLLDDTYNASPASTLAALNLLADLDVGHGRRIGVLGDMLELGSYEEEGHRLVGARAADVVDALITIGSRARWIAEEAVAAGLVKSQVRRVHGIPAAVALLREMIGPGDVVLVKGSRGSSMDEIVSALSLPRDEEQ
ncbi:MAG: UDP-N-acetylmuramoyl-tripeptide--D-alanyl-D-alanine ligase [Chloroflexota bacterium]|nr:UDP-N-acetylmuramoyl-tripeptide--D-alanyl-D-alanine ligase [Chloroflexota bacterium]